MTRPNEGANPLTTCTHCDAVREWAATLTKPLRAVMNGRVDRAPSSVDAASSNYGDCPCRCHIPHRIINKTMPRPAA